MLPPIFTPQLLRKIELLKVVSRRSFLGHRQGGHISPRRGHGIEFADYRKYEPGDNPRHIDWNLYGRSDRMYVKTFQEEQNLSVLCVVDTTASMFTSPGNKKFERARDITLALSYISLLQQEDVLLCLPGSCPLKSFYGARAIHAIAQLFEGVASSKPEVMRKEVLKAITGMHYPGVAVLISDLLIPLEDVRNQITLLRSKGLDVTVVQLLSSGDLDPLGGESYALAIDSESGEEVTVSLDSEERRAYHQKVMEHVDAVAAVTRQLGASHVYGEVEEELFSFLSTSLSRSGLLR